MTLRRYERYKDSGVEWLGAVPAHWNVLQLRRVIDRIEQGWSPECENRPAEEGEWGVLKTGCVNGGRFDPLENKALPNHLAAPPELEVAHNDLLMSRASGSPELVGSAALVNDTPPRLLLSDKTFRLHVNQRVDKQFLAWCLGSRLLRAQIECAISGAAGLANNLPQASLVEFVSPFPPVHEQRGIAAYLNREAAKIDELIAEQQRLIELLSEKRQAVVAHAVTKGLNPSATMKDSGVDWLGEVPSHWSIRRNKELLHQVDDRSIDEEGDLLTVSHLTGVTLRSEKNVNMILAETLEGYKRCKRGDLVINTMWAWMGAMGVSPRAGLVSPSYNVYRFRSFESVEPGYFDHLYRTQPHIAAVRANSTGVWESRLRLYPDTFLAMRTCCPPLAEQREIVEYLDERLSSMNAVRAEVARGTMLLAERRTALISAAVTGQIDVRQPSRMESTIAAHLQPHD